MAITLSDFLNFPFNGGKGVRTNQLFGEFVKAIGGDGAIKQQGADGAEVTVSLEDIVGAIGSNASVRVVHAANVALGRADQYVDAGFDWPELIPFLLVQWNPGGRNQHRSFSIIYNPRLGRYPADPTGLTAAAVGDAPSAANSTGYAVPFAIAADATRAITAAQASFGKSDANRALIACSDATQAPTPLVILAVTPSQVGVGPAKERVLQPEVDQTAGAGVTTLTLPADYTDFEFLELTVFDPNTASGVGDRVTDFIRVKTDWLSTQTDANAPKLAVLDSDEAGSRQWLTWTPSTRVLDRAVQGSNSPRIRISAARLYDTSVTTDAPEGGGLTDAQAEKLARYPENPAATPAAHLEPYALIGAYSTIAYSEPDFDTFNLDPGEVMVSPATQGGTRHGVLIGIRPEDSDAVDYAEVGLSLRLFDTSDGRAIVAGTAASVSSHRSGAALLVSISDHTVNSFNAGTDLRIEFGNKIAAMIAAIDVSSQGVDTTARASIESLRIRMNYLEKRGGATLQLYHLGAGNEQYTQAEFAALAGQNLTITGHIDDPTLLPDAGRFFLRIPNGAGGHTTKTQGGAGTTELQVFQLNAVERTARNQLTAGTVQFTFQLTAPEMAALFTDASSDAIDAAFVEFEIGMSEVAAGTNEEDVLAVFYEHLVGSAAGLTPEQAAEIQRDGQGVQTALAATRTNAAEIAANKTTAGNALERTALFKPLTVWERGNHARTVLFEYRPLEAVHTNVNATVRIGGSTINNVNPSEGLAALDDIGTILAVPVTAAQAANISNSADARAGYVRCQITAGASDTITGWMRTERTSWRALTGSSPYTVLATDDEFLINLRHTHASGINFPLIIPRLLLTQVAQNFGVDTQQPANADPQWGGVAVNLNAAGTGLTIAEAGNAQNRFSITSVLAR